MGQMALGLMWGCPAPSEWEFSVAEGYDAETHGVIARFEGNLKSHARLRVCREAMGDRAMVGVWVAVGGSGEPGVPYLGDKCLNLKSIESDYAASMEKAKSLFRKFSEYVSENEVVSLFSPDLWLILTEVA